MLGAAREGVDPGQRRVRVREDVIEQPDRAPPLEHPHRQCPNRLAHKRGQHLLPERRVVGEPVLGETRFGWRRRRWEGGQRFARRAGQVEQVIVEPFLGTARASSQP